MKKLLILAAALGALSVPSAASAAQTPCANGNPTDLCTTFNVAQEPAGPNCATGGVLVTLNDASYYVCNGASGSTGSAGAAGTAGVAGATGVAGAVGAKGADGSTGSAGAKGADGAAAQTCVSNRKFTIKVRERAGHRLTGATVTANDTATKAKRVNGRLTAVASFVGYHGVKGQVVPVLIQGQDHGKKVTAVRLYRICTPSKAVTVLNVPVLL